MDKDYRWVLVVTQPQREVWAAENVARLGHEYYLPRYKQKKTHLGKDITVLKPVFPRYLFVKIKTRWRFLTGTWGVQGVVVFGEEPETVPETVINALKAREDEDGFMILEPTSAARSFKNGETVRVTDGPLKGSLGLCVGQSNKTRQQILMTMLGRESVVSLPLNDLVLETK